ncbi:hypothetical protein L3X38_006910 [Prunus dulcis]|uniref:Uncharacterized protein n=1 Tax=Prunus dulcis TaxID=3755 RepID=A0AAD5F5F0_PRUDU|nr:hypothetical protein L3X38_006910 [Prunus dulcis]
MHPLSISPFLEKVFIFSGNFQTKIKLTSSGTEKKNTNMIKLMPHAAIRTEQNYVADHMAHMGENSNLGYQVVDLPPPSIANLLANDSVKMTTARLVPV